VCIVGVGEAMTLGLVGRHSSPRSPTRLDVAPGVRRPSLPPVARALCSAPLLSCALRSRSLPLLNSRGGLMISYCEKFDPTDTAGVPLPFPLSLKTSSYVGCSATDGGSCLWSRDLELFWLPFSLCRSESFLSFSVLLGPAVEDGLAGCPAEGSKATVSLSSKGGGNEINESAPTMGMYPSGGRGIDLREVRDTTLGERGIVRTEAWLGLRGVCALEGGR
jgi:hypothetical protein